MNNIKYMKKLKKVEMLAKETNDPCLVSKLLPPPPPSSNPDFLKCNSCSRTFNPKAHARHIKKCKDIINKPKMVKRKLKFFRLKKKK